jgi:hypothetical protein
MDINLSLSPANTIINKLAVVIYKASAPNVQVASQEFDPPHSSPRNITFADVDPVTYIVNTYETTGLPTLGILRHSFIYDPSFSGVAIRDTEFLYMTAGQTGYTDESWVGWEIESIERVGVGTQYPEQDVAYFQKTGVYTSYRQNGFDLVAEGDVFQDQEKFVIRFKPQIQLTPVTTNDAYSGVLVIEEDILIEPEHVGNMFFVRGTFSTVNIQLSAITLLGVNKLLSFAANGGGHKKVKITSFGGSDLFRFNGTTVSEILLGQCESIEFVTDQTWGFIVKSFSSTILQAGQFVDAYDTDNEPNVVHADGSLLDRDVDERLWKAVQNMPPSCLVTDAVWNETTDGANNKGFYSIGDGSTTFRIPRIYAAGVLKAVDGSTRIPGSYEADDIKSHTHDVKGEASSATGQGALTDGTNNGQPTVIKTESTGGSENLIKTYGTFKLIRK